MKGLNLVPRALGLLVVAAFCLGWSPLRIAKSLPGVQKPTVETWGPARLVTFQTPNGKVRVILPGEIAPGDRITGTVLAEPDPKSPSGLAEVKVSLAEVHGVVVDEETPNVTWAVPSTGMGFLPVALLGPKGETLGSVSLPLSEASAPPKGFITPRFLQPGRPLSVAGPFDGRSANTSLNLGELGAPVLAESPRQTIALAPADAEPGSTRLSLSESGKRVSAQARVVSLSLTVPKTSLRPGERTVLMVSMTGLSGVEDPGISYSLANLNAETVDLQGGARQSVLVSPVEVGPEGSYRRTFEITGRTNGTFAISATLEPGANPEVEANVPRTVSGNMLNTSQAPGASATKQTLQATPAPYLSVSVPAQFGLFNGLLFDVAGGAPGAKAPCDESLNKLMEILDGLLKLLRESNQNIENNPLVQEVRLYETVAKLLAAPDEWLEALKKLAQGKVKEFVDSMKTEEGAMKTLDLLRRAVEFLLVNDSTLTDAQRRALNTLRNRIIRLQQRKAKLDEIRKELEAIVADMKKLAENPLGLVQEKLEEGLKQLVERLLVQAVGKAAAGAILSIAQDVASLAQFLSDVSKRDELKKKIDDLKRKIYDTALKDPCFKIDAGWNAAREPYLWLMGDQWSGAKIRVRVVLHCWDPVKKQYVDCPDHGIKIRGRDAEASDAIEAEVPPLAANEVWKLPYELDVSNARKCGEKCLVLLEVEREGSTGKTEAVRLFAGALP